MKYLTLIILLFFTISCASTTYTPAGQKKASFNPMWDSDCVVDTTISSTLLGPGRACAHDNGVSYIKHNTGKFKLTKAQMDERAQKFCQISDRNAVYAGKANVQFLSSLDWGGEEYLCK